MGSTTTNTPFSPAELAYLHASLSLQPPIRPDGRLPHQFRTLSAETGILPGTNGSARVCFADGTEAVVGCKAEVERTVESVPARKTEDEDGRGENDRRRNTKGKGSASWIELSVEIPGARDDDSSTAFLGEMLSEALVVDGEVMERLWINSRFHWKIYLDILLISPALSYPLPLLSLTTHLALLATRLPRLKSEGDEDPLFDDDWDASTFLYPRHQGKAMWRPPVTLLVMAVGNNIIFDPSKEELAVADFAMAISVGDKGGDRPQRDLQLLTVRMIDPPSRMTPPGVPNSINTAAMAAVAGLAKAPETINRDWERTEGVWRAKRGGVKMGMMQLMIAEATKSGGVADEVLDGLEGVELT